MYFRDQTATLKDVNQHRLWVALEAGSGIVPQHDYDPESSCAGWSGCSFWSHGQPGAWWNVTNDPIDPSGEESPLWAFTKHRALNRLALRTKLNISSAAATATTTTITTDAAPPGYVYYPHENCYDGAGGHEIDSDPASVQTARQCTKRCDDDETCDCVVYSSGDCWKRSACVPAEFEKDSATTPYSVYVKKVGPKPPPEQAGGALAYLKHDSMGPAGDACIMVFNPGAAQNVTIDLTGLPASLLDGSVVPHDLLVPKATHAAPPLAAAWTVSIGAGEVKALGGFTLATFAPRLGKKTSCTADDHYSWPASATTLQGCFLACLNDAKCENVFVDYPAALSPKIMEKPPPVSCKLLGSLRDPSKGCSPGNGTLIKKLGAGRPQPVATTSAAS